VSGLLVIGAHPDDEVLLAGGTLAACARAGAWTGVVSLTRGEEGPMADGAGATRAKLADVRVAELRAACELLGVSWMKCFRRRDGELPWAPAAALARQLAALIGRRAPDVVVSFGPDGVYWHPDHIAVHRLVARAIDRLGSAAPALYESVWEQASVRGLIGELRARGLPHDLWGLEPEAFGVADAGDAVAVDVRPVVATKLAALRCHRSQLGPDHAFSVVPDELALRFLGCERFRRVRPSGAVAGEPLLDLAAAATKQAAVG
jgi:N-acetyl-1-D-myo-inositol-2-amino-2-deoxy-alpha-D-glucopyranoside deacetylase